MDRNKRLFKNTIIYFIGTFGSKLFVFLLLPLYSKYLTTEQYGNLNLVTNLIPLIGPIFTLQITDCIFRFLCTAKEEDKNKYISNALFLITLGFILFIIIYIPITIIIKFQYTTLFLLYFIMNYLAVFMQQILRGMKKNIDYSITGVISTIIQLLVNIFMIKILYEKSILLATITGSIIIIVYGIIRTNIFKHFNIYLISKKIIKEMLYYSLPLIPNQISWWFNDIVGLYILKLFIGTSATGITSLSNKFPTIIATMNSIFLLAWTENSIYEYKSNDKDEYYSKSIQLFIICILITSCFLLPAIKVYFELFINQQYAESIGLVPIMFCAMLFNAAASFLGTIYTASMKTKYAFYTTAIAAISNIILSFALIPKFNIYGYAFANLISYIIFFMVRKKSINKIINLKEQLRLYMFPSFVYSMTVFIYYIGNYRLNITYEFVLIIMILKKYNKQIRLIYNKIKNEIKRKRVTNEENYL